jgi:hypothetical protein
MIATALNGCASIVPNEFLVTKEKIEQKLQSRFPVHRDRAHGIFKLDLAKPEMVLDEKDNVIRFEGGYTAFAASLSFEGQYRFSSKLRYDPKDRAIFLKDPKFESLQISNEKLVVDVSKELANRILEEYADTKPIYQFSPDEMIILKNKVDIGAIDVLSTGIRLKIHTIK